VSVVEETLQIVVADLSDLRRPVRQG